MKTNLCRLQILETLEDGNVEVFFEDLSRNKKHNEYLPIGSYKGFDLFLSDGWGGKMLQLRGKHFYTIEPGQSALGNITRIENKAAEIPNLLQSFLTEITDTQNNLQLAEEQLTVPFSEETQLEQKKTRLIELIAEMDVTAGTVQETTYDNTQPIEP